MSPLNSDPNRLQKENMATVLVYFNHLCCNCDLHGNYEELINTLNILLTRNHEVHLTLCISQLTWSLGGKKKINKEHSINSNKRALVLQHPLKAKCMSVKMPFLS